MILPLYLTTQESAKRHARMPALVEKDNRLIWHCRASKYKNGPVIGMRVPLYIEEELIFSHFFLVLVFLYTPYYCMSPPPPKTHTPS